MAASQHQSTLLEQLLLQPGGNIEQCCTQLLEYVRRELGFQQAPIDSPATLRFAQRYFPPLLQKMLALDPRSSPNTTAWMFSSTRWYDGMENLWQTRQQALSSYRPEPRMSPRGMQIVSNVNSGGGEAMSPSPQQRGFGADGRLVDARAIAAVEPGSVGPTLRARVSGMMREGAAIVRLLTPLADGSGPTVFDVVWRRHVVQYSYALALLPAPRRDATEGLPGARFLVLRNELLYSHCLATPLAQQLRLHAEERRAWDMRLAYEYSNVAAAAAGGQVAAAPPPLQLTLRMCEYFCFAFARYAAATPIDMRFNGQRAGSISGSRPTVAGNGGGSGGYGSGYGGDEASLRGLRMVRAWLRFGVLGLVSGSPYNALVLDYARCFFPHTPQAPSSSTASAAAASAPRGRLAGGAAGVPGWEYAAGGATTAGGGAEMGIEAELFLRTAAEFWLNHNELLLATATLEDLHAAASGAVAGSGGRGASSLSPWQAASANGYGQLTSGYPSPSRDPATVIVVGEYAPPPDLALHALLTLCSHLLADPAVARRSAGGVAEAAALTVVGSGDGSGGGRSGRAGDARASPLAARGAAAAAAYSSAGRPGAVAAAVVPETVVASAMTPALAALQPMVFDFLRAAFCRCPLDCQPALLLAAELWLLWMQPWAACEPLAGRPPLQAGAAMAGGSGSFGGGGAAGGGGRGGGASGGMASPRAGAKVFANLANVLQHGGGGGHGSTGSRGRGYSDDWRAWVLANRDFYTVLLAAFVRKAIELPFVGPADRRGAGGGGATAGGSGGHGGYGGSDVGGAASAADGLDLLARILSVYTVPLLEVLHGGVAVGATLEAREAVAAAAVQSPPGEQWQAANAAAVSSSGDLASLPGGFGGGEVALLRAAREVMRPSLGGATCILERYGDDAQRLGEEVAMQLARVDAAARARGGLGTVMAGLKRGGDTHAQELRVLAGLRLVFSLPANWHPQAHVDVRRGGSPGAGGSGSGSRSRWGRSTMPERSTICPAFLTAAGRRQLVEGQRRCLPEDPVPLPGDPLSRPPLPSELKLVCRALVWLSRRLNDAQERARVGGAEQWLALAAEREAAAADVTEEYALLAPDERPSAVLIRARQWTVTRALGPGPWVLVNLRPFADKGNFGWTVAAVLLLQLRLMRWVEGVAVLVWMLWVLVLQPAWRWLEPAPPPLREEY